MVNTLLKFAEVCDKINKPLCLKFKRKEEGFQGLLVSDKKVYAFFYFTLNERLKEDDLIDRYYDYIYKVIKNIKEEELMQIMNSPVKNVFFFIEIKTNDFNYIIPFTININNLYTLKVTVDSEDFIYFELYFKKKAKKVRSRLIKYATEKNLENLIKQIVLLL
ncbi:MAG: hypothetical protein ABGW69_02850 [Nanoarchaeota archaeon]